MTTPRKDKRNSKQKQSLSQSWGGGLQSKANLIRQNIAVELDDTLKQMKERLVATFHPEKIYLFGSKARGDAGRDSDYDILMVVSKSSEPGYRRAQQAHRALLDVPFAADIIVLTHDEFERKKSVVGSLPETVLHEGKTLYAA